MKWKSLQIGSSSYIN